MLWALQVSPMTTSHRFQRMASLTALLAFPVVASAVVLAKPLPNRVLQPLPVHAVLDVSSDQIKRCSSNSQSRSNESVSLC